MENGNLIKKDRYKVSRILYIIQTAVEYFIAALAEGAYIAKIATTIGIPDDVTAILTATVSLGIGFQLFALFLPRNKRAKGFVIPWASIYQLMLTIIYFIPCFNLSRETKTTVLFIILIAAQAVRNTIDSPKTRWLSGSHWLSRAV